ncbi:DNA-binding transcriptional regulator, LysR family [Humidesulfovibrio mexicanus]|uniref:DNA-binding transcriptional regulator, LysR family n=1 Tax=Humidesulfovibrio mexicanus TaxID=147047 RepID=A0A238Z1U4_9BACT|nr:LysR family transcriptional regulator [Humidesulfovibrio mexicanus]SNR77347.1 DNA-binding transcriptional regulator, LysR family [Humidesulfovibrio mexicanus]
MSFDLTDLRLFLNIADSGSITGGAEHSHLALASASARIRNMEELLGVPLLLRGRRGVKPTEAGLTLVHHGRIVLDQWERMLGDLGEYAAGLRGHVRLLSNTISMTEFLPALLTGYLAEHPNVSIDLKERLSTEIVQEIVDGKADVGVMAKSADTGALEIFPCRKLSFVLVTPPGHPLDGRSQAAFGEALKYDFVGLAEDSPLQRFLEGHAARLGREMSYRVRLRDFYAVGDMVSRGIGVAVMPETAAERCRETRDIRVVRLTDSWVTRNMVLCVRHFDELPVHVRELVESLRS